MNLKALRYFLTIVEEQSITGAAEYLQISQPSLSRQMKELEKHLGHKLFERGSRSITLTPAGELLRDRAREIVLLTDRAEMDLATIDQPIAGSVYIGAGETQGFSTLVEAAIQVRQRYPQVRFHIYSGNSESVTDQLESGLLDFALILDPADTTQYSNMSLPRADRWGLLMPKDCQLASRSSVRKEDLRGLPLLVSRQARFDRKFSSWGDISEDNINVVATYNLLYNASLFVERGCGYALCLDGIINISGESKVTFRPLEPSLTSHMNVSWKSNRQFTPAARLYLDVLQRLIRQ